MLQRTLELKEDIFTWRTFTVLRTAALHGHRTTVRTITGVTVFDKNCPLTFGKFFYEKGSNSRVTNKGRVLKCARSSWENRHISVRACRVFRAWSRSLIIDSRARDSGSEGSGLSKAPRHVGPPNLTDWYTRRIHIGALWALDTYKRNVKKMISYRLIRSRGSFRFSLCRRGVAQSMTGANRVNIVSESAAPGEIDFRAQSAVNARRIKLERAAHHVASETTETWTCTGAFKGRSLLYKITRPSPEYPGRVRSIFRDIESCAV